MPCPSTRYLGPLRKEGRRGQALVEFVVSILVLMVLLLGVFEFGRHYYTRLTVRHAVADAARFGTTGRHLADPDSGDSLTRAESIVWLIRQRVARLGLEEVSIRLDPADGGGPSEVVRIEAHYRFSFNGSALLRAFAPATLDFTASTTVRNEPVF